MKAEDADQTEQGETTEQPEQTATGRRLVNGLDSISVCQYVQL